MCARAGCVPVDPFTELAEEWRMMPVARAYVFGSFAVGAQGPLSDVDVAILPNTFIVERLHKRGPP